MKQFDAETFNKQPAKAYRAADLGEEVYITHAHYPDRIFVLTAEAVAWTPVKTGKSSDEFIQKLSDLDL